MNYFFLTPIQKNVLFVITIIVMLFIFIFFPIIIGKQIDSKNVILLTLLFFAWLGFTMIFTNALMFNNNNRILE